MADRKLLRSAGKIVLALALILSVAGIFQHDLWTPDEPREAEIGRAMLASDFSSVPTLGEEVFLEKPPLFAWIHAATFSVFGADAGTTRIPSTLFAVGTIWIAYLLGRRAAGRVAGACTAAVAATMWQFSETMHKGVLDTALAFFVVAGHLVFLRLKDENRTRDYAAIGVLSGLAFLTKGFIGPGLMCAPPLLAAAALRDWTYVKRVLPRAAAASVIGVLLFGVPWVLAVVAAPNGGWEGVKICLWDNTLGRTMGGKSGGYSFSGHSKWFGYYAVAFFQATAPWCLSVPAWFKGGTLSRTWRDGRVAFCGLVFLTGVLLLSIPSGKRELYLVPLLPSLAVVPGVWLSRIGSRRGSSWDRPVSRTLHVVATVAFVALAVVMAWLAFALPLPGALSKFALDEVAAQRGTALVAMALTGLWVLGPHLWLKRRLIPRTALGPQLAASLVTVFVVVHGAALPLFDPAKRMAEGARRVAELVPPGEKLLAISADETTRAILPFYTGRILHDWGGDWSAEQVAKEFDKGTARYLIVADDDVDELSPRKVRDPVTNRVRTTPDLAARLELVEAVQVNATRVLHVYALRR
jgi:4-amino-4-deoxy-L-arabinose transferase-like glycosyltransferase